MKYKINDVVWCKLIAKAAVVRSVGDGYYEVRTYGGKVLTVTESELGKA